MFQRASGVVVNGGTLINHTSGGMSRPKIDDLLEWVATEAFHNSDEPCDAPKCHPRTRTAVLNDIVRWVGESESAREDFMMWLFGPAGAGKSAIARRIAEIALEKGLLIATFFFSRTSPTRNTKDRLVPTLAYQLALSNPDTRTHIEHAIERDPAIFKKNIQTQIDTLLVTPFQLSLSAQTIPPKLIVIDGLDECHDSKVQVAILDAISHAFSRYNLPIKFLVVSRSEIDLVTAFNINEPLKSIHRRVVLDDTYRPDEDIRLFFSDKFEHIKRNHPLRSTIPTSWPTQETLQKLVDKSSGQFIYAATVVKFVESNRHRPSVRLDTVLGILPPGNINPFSELDALYNHILSSVDDIQLTLRVLSLYALAPDLASRFHDISMSLELFLSLEPGDIQVALINLSSIVSFDESSGEVQILHASLVDFLSDKRRSTIHYIDMADVYTDFARRFLQYASGPDGIPDSYLLNRVCSLYTKIPKGRLWNDILNFDLDSFINAIIRREYTEPIILPTYTYPVLATFHIWREILDTHFNDGDEWDEALGQCHKSFVCRIQKYQSDWRLQMLLTLAAVVWMNPSDPKSQMKFVYGGPDCRLVDILLEMDGHDLHLLDQNALDLRHGYMAHNPIRSELTDIVSDYVDGDEYASAALHCMRFLCDAPKCSHSQRNDSPEMGVIYTEWKSTCDLALVMLGPLLREANPSPKLVQFMNNYDIHPSVQKEFSDHHLRLDVNILAFLSRENMCTNWRIISAIRRALIVKEHPPSKLHEKDAGCDERLDMEMIQSLKRQSMDHCCRNLHYGVTRTSI